tara:strand:+ start:59 stop:1273 length:1215 start_codon:yes stop_codon:yes gene_type:complete
MLNIEEIRSCFPILNCKVNGHDLIYLDNAATTQKPEVVIDEISNYYKNENANIHRGVHFLSGLSTNKFEQTRGAVKDFIGAKYNHEIIFTKGTTDSINLIANGYHSMLKAGDEIIISEIEHHSNIVPWQACCEATGASLKIIPFLENGDLDMTEFKNLISKNTKLIAVSHVSNTLGSVSPIKDVIEIAHNFGAKVLIDGAQAAAHIPLNMMSLGADFYVFSAHKIYGPTGVGILYGKEDALNTLPAYQKGGGMIKQVSLNKTNYGDLPHKFEAGTPNIAGVIAFKKALDFITKIGVLNIAKHENELLKYATSEILKIEGVKIYGNSNQKVGVLSFNVKNLHPYDIGIIVDKLGVAIRTGHHCTQPIMEKYKVAGAARISFAAYNTKQEVDICIDAIKHAKKMLS